MENCANGNTLEAMLQDLNIEGDNCLEEFVSAIGTLGQNSDVSDMHGLDGQTLQEIFQVFDESGEQEIVETSDLRALLESMGEELSEADIDDMISQIEVDGEGNIDFEAFMACLKEDGKLHIVYTDDLGEDLEMFQHTATSDKPHSMTSHQLLVQNTTDEEGNLLQMIDSTNTHDSVRDISMDSSRDMTTYCNSFDCNTQGNANHNAMGATTSSDVTDDYAESNDVTSASKYCTHNALSSASYDRHKSDTNTLKNDNASMHDQNRVFDIEENGNFET